MGRYDRPQGSPQLPSTATAFHDCHHPEPCVSLRCCPKAFSRSRPLLPPSPAPTPRASSTPPRRPPRSARHSPEGEALRLAALAGAHLLRAVQDDLRVLAQGLANGLGNAWLRACRAAREAIKTKPKCAGLHRSGDRQGGRQQPAFTCRCRVPRRCKRAACRGSAWLRLQAPPDAAARRNRRPGARMCCTPAAPVMPPMLARPG